MDYVAPMMRSFSKEDIRNNIVASATCKVAVCGAGTSFTCGTTTNYVHRIPEEII